MAGGVTICPYAAGDVTGPGYAPQRVVVTHHGALPRFSASRCAYPGPFVLPPATCGRIRAPVYAWPVTISRRLPSRRRLSGRTLLWLPAVALLAAVTGCSSTDAKASAAVPSPSTEEAALCRALHKELPKTVADLDRNDPEPRSELTAGWGDAAIVLRCGVPRPEKMSDAQSDAVEADGVNWMLEERDSGPRFTTTYRKTYVEVTMSSRFNHDSTPLAELAGPVRKTVPSSL